MNKKWKDGIIGFVVGDAIGVPVEFTSREDRRLDPVIGMREYGTHNQPKGTWSDDSSMTFATIDSIKKCEGIDLNDLMDRFYAWYANADYTPFQDVFDIGIATSRAMINYAKGEKPVNCGGKSEWDNGNGSLMRILPVCLYLYDKQKKVCTSEDESIYYIHNVSSLTHAHLRSQIACGIYYFLVKSIFENRGNLLECLQKGIDQSYDYYRRDFSNLSELQQYKRLINLQEFKEIDEKEIRSSGYVVHTLEAVLWCLLTTDTYERAVLKAVNLGDDTDTVGAITGSLAGLFYGVDAIPTDWKECIQCKAWIQTLLQ